MQSALVSELFQKSPRESVMITSSVFKKVIAVPHKLIIKFSVKKKRSKKQKTAQCTFIYVILREKYKMLHYVSIPLFIYQCKKT